LFSCATFKGVCQANATGQDICVWRGKRISWKGKKFFLKYAHGKEGKMLMEEGEYACGKERFLFQKRCAS